MIPHAAITILLGVYSVNGYSIPRAITTLLAAKEMDEVKHNRFSLNTPEYFTNMDKYNSLVKRARLGLVQSRADPACLGSPDSATLSQYDNQCSFSITPSEYCCEVFAEQACADPSTESNRATAIVRERTSGLGGAANSFLYDNCMANSCSGACSLSEGNEATCRQCSYTCQRVCLANMSYLCLSRVCGQNWVSLSSHALAHSYKRNSELQENTDKEVQKSLRISSEDLHNVEKAEMVKLVLGMLDQTKEVPMCTPTELVASDRSAGVFVNSAGSTYAEALMACVNSVLNPQSISLIMENPSILTDSSECSVVSTCERNHLQLALDRASSELQKRASLISGFANQ